MVFWWLSLSPSLLAASYGLVVFRMALCPLCLIVSPSIGLPLDIIVPGLLVAFHGLLVNHIPLSSPCLIFWLSRGLLVALLVSLSSRCLSWSLGIPYPPGFFLSHLLTFSWSFGGSPDLLVFMSSLQVYT